MHKICFSHVQLCATPLMAAHQAPPSLELSRQEHWSGLPFPSPGVLPDPGIKPRSPTLQADTLPSEPPGKPLSTDIQKEIILCGFLGEASRLRLFVTPWTVAHQDPLARGFFRQQYWSGSSFPTSGDLPDPGIKPRSLALQVDSLSFFNLNLFILIGG